MNLLLDYWPVAAFIFNLVIGGLLWAAKRQFSTKEEMTLIDTRLGRVETAITQMPTRDDVARMRVEMAEISGTVKETNAHMLGLNRLVERVENAVVRHENIFADAARGSK